MQHYDYALSCACLTAGGLKAHHGLIDTVRHNWQHLHRSIGASDGLDSSGWNPAITTPGGSITWATAMAKLNEAQS